MFQVVVIYRQSCFGSGPDNKNSSSTSPSPQPSHASSHTVSVVHAQKPIFKSMPPPSPMLYAKSRIDIKRPAYLANAPLPRNHGPHLIAPAYNYSTATHFRPPNYYANVTAAAPQRIVHSPQVHHVGVRQVPKLDIDCERDDNDDLLPTLRTAREVNLESL